MPLLQVSDTTARKAHAAAVQRSGKTAAGTALQQAYDAAVARANKVASRELHLVTTFALGGEIETIEQEAADAAAAGDFTTHIALSAVARRLKTLIPV